MAEQGFYYKKNAKHYVDEQRRKGLTAILAPVKSDKRTKYKVYSYKGE